jgi:DNA-binding IclR family transcriptional regulator
MGIRDRLNIVYVETSRSTAMFSRQLSDIGLSQPIAKTAIGRAYLAACGAAEREAILNEIRIKTPQIWESHWKKVQASLSDYESFGFCTSWGDMRSDVHAVGVSLRLVSTGDIVAFNCALQSFLVTPEQIRSDIGPRLVAMVRGLAAA